MCVPGLDLAEKHMAGLHVRAQHAELGPRPPHHPARLLCMSVIGMC